MPPKPNFTAPDTTLYQTYVVYLTCTVFWITNTHRRRVCVQCVQVQLLTADIKKCLCWSLLYFSFHWKKCDLVQSCWLRCNEEALILVWKAINNCLCLVLTFLCLHSQQFAEPLQKAEGSLVVCGSFWKALSCKSISCHSLMLCFSSWQSRKLTHILWIPVQVFKSIFSDEILRKHFSWLYFSSPLPFPLTLFLQHHFVGHFLHQELSHAAMEMYRAIGRLRSARLVGKSLAEFYM